MISNPRIKKDFYLLKKQNIASIMNTYREFKIFKEFTKNINDKSNLLIISIFLVYGHGINSINF